MSALLDYWHVRIGLVMLAGIEIFMLPFAVAIGPWSIMLIPPILLVGIAAFSWGFDKAVRWADRAPKG